MIEIVDNTLKDSIGCFLMDGKGDNIKDMLLLFSGYTVHTTKDKICFHHKLFNNTQILVVHTRNQNVVRERKLKGIGVLMTLYGGRF
jgi:hypothetical protein